MKKKQVKQARIKAKNESNKGDDKGEKDYQTALRYSRNLITARATKAKIKLEMKLREIRLFISSIIKVKAKAKREERELSEKSLIIDLQKAFKTRKLELSRAKYYRLKAKLSKRDEKLKADKLFKSDNAKRITEDQFRAAVSGLKPLSQQELLAVIQREILPDFIENLALKSNSIKEGRNRGSAKGGEKTRNNNI